ncbi:hypothetical protein VTL71DRAFT_6450 [Oculimacula yallundae]|uniref:Uncharacterized protein n=1 Tax=Oculimacula yallundae TaxID=86028 RepID=A0ABR4BWZ8_9HELO
MPLIIIKEEDRS